MSQKSCSWFHLFSVVLHASNHFGSSRHIPALSGKLSFSEAISVLREMLRAVSTQEDFELLVTTTLLIQYDGKSLQPYHAVLIVYWKWKECGWGKESFSWFASIMALRGGDAFGPAWCRWKFEMLQYARLRTMLMLSSRGVLCNGMPPCWQVRSLDMTVAFACLFQPLGVIYRNIKKYCIKNVQWIMVNGTNSWNQSQVLSAPEFSTADFNLVVSTVPTVHHLSWW